VRGLHEVCKSLECKESPALCILADDCSEDKYKKFVEALCKEKSVPLYRIPSRAQLGEWVGLCKFDQTGKARNIIGCSSAVIKKFQEDKMEIWTITLIKSNRNLTSDN
jgi:small subunit ribosomal protein S12e